MYSAQKRLQNSEREIEICIGQISCQHSNPAKSCFHGAVLPLCIFQVTTARKIPRRTFTELKKTKMCTHMRYVHVWFASR